MDRLAMNSLARIHLDGVSKCFIEGISEDVVMPATIEQNDVKGVVIQSLALRCGACKVLKLARRALRQKAGLAVVTKCQKYDNRML